jgi:hypothetical protein
MDGISDFNALHSRKYDHEVLSAPSIFSYKGTMTCESRR